MFASLRKLFIHPTDGSPRARTSVAQTGAMRHRQVGNEHLGRGDLEAAAQAYGEALTLAPDDVGTLVNLGYVLSERKMFVQARVHLERATRLAPGEDDAFYFLAVAQLGMGDNPAAIGNFRKSLALKPDFLACRLGLCRMLFEAGEIEEARGCVEAGLKLAPGSADLYYFLGNLDHEARHLESAIAHYGKALLLAPTYAEVHANLANSQQERGELDLAIASAREALRLKPDLATAHSNLLFALNYDPDKSVEEIFAAYREYDEQMGVPLRASWRDHRNACDSAKRLKVGYVSPDFRQHSVRHFLEPLLAHHDKRSVEVFAYAELTMEDAVTARYRGYVDHWVPTAGMSDEALATRVGLDSIDILVDLAGHTGKNRLGVFARKPAPVSVSWLGCGYTSGLSAIDYLLADNASAPEDSDALFAETPWHLETPSYAYRPAEGMDEVGSLPALGRGFVTFGTLTRAVRINHRTLRAWSRILERVPRARLVVDSWNFQEPTLRDALLRNFAALGIAPDRLEVGYHSPPWDVLRGMDIGLDCFPHNSGTTLFESLYMGVPFITLAGRPSVGRLGSSILHGVGHPEWIANSEDAYVELAVALASDLPCLATLRSGLRPEMQASALMDEPGFARKVEAAYREMFSRWVAATATREPATPAFPARDDGRSAAPRSNPNQT